MLYQQTDDELILFIRDKKREAVREKAFGVITTLDIQTVVAKILFSQEDEIAVKEKFRNDPKFWQQQKEKFVKEFRKNPKALSDKIWESVNKYRVEFEKENLEEFLEFYFNDEDEAISQEMFKVFLDVKQLYKEKNTNTLNAFFVHPLLELIDKVNTFMAKLNIFDFSTLSTENQPRTKLSIFEGESKSDETKKEQVKTKGLFGFIRGVFKSKTINEQQEIRVLAELDLENTSKYYNADKDKLEQSFIVNVGDKTYIFTLNIGYNSDIYLTLDYMNGEIVQMTDMDKVKDYLGIGFRVSDDKKTLYIIKTDNFNEDTKIYPLNEQWDIPFQNMNETDSVEFDKNIDFSDDEKNAIKKDTGTNDTADIYLDDYIDNPSELQAKIKNASENNELIIVHFFRNNDSIHKIIIKIHYNIIFIN